MKLHYQNHLKPYAQKLRQSGNLSEVLLWNEIKGNKLGYRFLRQRPLGNYIVDFFCHSLALAIEIDGAASHDSKIERDEKRQKELEEMGINIIRCKDAEVRYNLDGVVAMIKAEIQKSSAPTRVGAPPLPKSPSPPLEKGE